MLVIERLGEQALQLAFVAAVGLDLVLGRLKEVLDQCGVAVARAAGDGIGSCHGADAGDGDGDGDGDDARKCNALCLKKLSSFRFASLDKRNCNTVI